MKYVFCSQLFIHMLITLDNSLTKRITTHQQIHPFNQINDSEILRNSLCQF